MYGNLQRTNYNVAETQHYKVRTVVKEPYKVTLLASQKQGQMGHVRQGWWHANFEFHWRWDHIRCLQKSNWLHSRMAEPLWIISCGGLEVIGDRICLHMYAVPEVSNDAVLVKMYMLKCNKWRMKCKVRQDTWNLNCSLMIWKVLLCYKILNLQII